MRYTRAFDPTAEDGYETLLFCFGLVATASLLSPAEQPSLLYRPADLDPKCRRSLRGRGERAVNRIFSESQSGEAASAIDWI
jgi:hypothetical protein